jgi:hypothetical protein
VADTWRGTWSGKVAHGLSEWYEVAVMRMASPHDHRPELQCRARVGWWAISRRLFLALTDGLDVVTTHGCLLVDGAGKQAHA